MNTFLYIDLGLFIITTGAVAVAYFWFNKPIDKV